MQVKGKRMVDVDINAPSGVCKIQVLNAKELVNKNL